MCMVCVPASPAPAAAVQGVHPEQPAPLQRPTPGRQQGCRQRRGSRGRGPWQQWVPPWCACPRRMQVRRGAAGGGRGGGVCRRCVYSSHSCVWHEKGDCHHYCAPPSILSSSFVVCCAHKVERSVVPPFLPNLPPPPFPPHNTPPLPTQAAPAPGWRPGPLPSPRRVWLLPWRATYSRCAAASCVRRLPRVWWWAASMA
jgi:hypothetical protein